MKEVKMYVAEDGKVFNDRNECYDYEYELKLKAVNPTAKTITFTDPMDVLNEGEFVIFHAEKEEDLRDMVECLGAFGQNWDSEVHLAIKSFVPGDYIAIVQYCCDWIQVDTRENVMNGMRSMLTDMENWHV